MMNYRVEISRRAEQDRDAAYAWYCSNFSEEFALRWYRGISDAIRSLAESPLRCGIARENDLVSFELRELVYGRWKNNRFRILFTIEGDAVRILHLRHTARREMDAHELLEEP